MIFNSITQIRVTYADTDKMGYSYYGNYPVYFEVARTEMLRQTGITYKQIEDNGFILPVASLQVKYLKPALYDELLTIKTTLNHDFEKKLNFNYEVYNSNNELITTAETLLIFVNQQTRRPVKAPEFFVKAVTNYLSK